MIRSLYHGERRRQPQFRTNCFEAATLKATVGRRGSGSGGASGGAGGGGGSDECDLAFETDLAAVNAQVTGGLSPGDELSVVLVEQHGFPSVACRTDSGEVVGSLANVEDLAQLIGCMQQGNVYIATIRDVGPTYCTVFVERH